MEEHQFLANCLQIGLRLEDLKRLEYKDIAKIFISLLPSDKKYRKATASDWDNFM